jgi:hypothetical protein
MTKTHSRVRSPAMVGGRITGGAVAGLTARNFHSAVSYLNPHLHHHLLPCAAAHLGILCFPVSSSAVSLAAYYTRTKAVLQILFTDRLPQ